MEKDSSHNSYNVEVAQEVTPETVWVREKDAAPNTNSAKALGVVSLVLSILGLFWYAYLSATAGIILGVLGVKRGSSLGWWAIALGVIAIVIHVTWGVITFPFRLFS